MGAWIEGFVHPALAAGALLCSVPLLIHLLNRRRHRPLEWGGMRFVLAAYKKTRRRAQLENLLLLLLRMAAIALFAFALARPFTGSESPLGLLTEKRRDLILVVDGSASTGYRENVETVFERVVERARDLLGSLDGSRGDRVRLVLAGSYPRLVSWRSPEDALSVLGTLDPGDEGLDLAATLGEVVRYAEEDAQSGALSNLEVRLLCDLQRSVFAPGELNFGEEEAQVEGEAPLFEQLDRLQELGLELLVEDLGPSQRTPPNLGIAVVAPLGPILGPGIPSEIAVRVRNHGTNLRAGVRVALEVDGERLPSRLIEIPARGEAEAVFPVSFRRSGQHVLEATLEGDRLPIDDSYVQVAMVPPSVRVLLVNGAPSDRIDEDEVGLLRVVLDPLDEGPAGLDRFAPFEVEVASPEMLGLGEVDLDDWDVIVLANVESVSHRTVEALEERVAAGASLWITVGDRVIPENYNARLWRPDQTGLLPAELERRVGSSARDSYYRAGSFDPDHPALGFFADDRWKPLFTEIPVYEFLSLRPLPEGSGTNVLARLDDEAASPLLVERAYDRGRVFLWTTSIDSAWTRLPESPRTMVPLVHELLRYAGKPQHLSRNVGVGEPLTAEVDTFPRGLALVRPDGARRPLTDEPTDQGDGSWLLPTVSDTDLVGLWRLEMEGREAVAFAVHFDAREGDLSRMSFSELDALHPALVPLGGEEESGREEKSRPRKGELWRGFAQATLALLVLEALWAAWIGRSRRLVG